MSPGLQRRAAGNHQIMGEVAIGTLAETFSDMTGNFSGRFGKLFVKIAIFDQFPPLQEWRNCVDAFESLRINQQIL